MNIKVGNKVIKRISELHYPTQGEKSGNRKETKKCVEGM